MSVKADTWIQKMAQEKGMIEPFEPKQIRKGISFGLSSYGYDFRLGNEFKIFRPKSNAVIDPKDFDKLEFETEEGATCIIPARSYVLGRTLEYFRIPRDILTICYGKSTYARCGVFVNVTPFEPEWEGFATLAISNHTAVPVKLYAGEGIGQLIFLQADEICAVSYADKKGKYQKQLSVTGAKI